ncbi:MAG: adenine phosphoribosyltransferase [bacterium]
MEEIKQKIRTIPNFPKEGIMFRDITTLLKDPAGFKLAVEVFVKRYRNIDIDCVMGIEARGFILGGAVAYELGKGFVPIRKPGKLPAEVVSEEYALEYGTDKVEMHKDAIKKGDRCLIIDDLLATGGTMLAACNLAQKLGAKIVECAFIVELPDLGGKNKLSSFNIFTMVEFEGE